MTDKIKYSQTPQGKAAQHRADVKRRQSVKFRISQKRYRESEKGLTSQRVGRMRYIAHHPERYKARYLISSAIQSGKLPKAKTLQCSCGEKAQHYHHHLDYAPEHIYDVIPVCRECHSQVNSDCAFLA